MDVQLRLPLGTGLHVLVVSCMEGMAMLYKFLLFILARHDQFLLSGSPPIYVVRHKTLDIEFNLYFMQVEPGTHPWLGIPVVNGQTYLSAEMAHDLLKGDLQTEWDTAFSLAPGYENVTCTEDFQFLVEALKGGAK